MRRESKSLIGRHDFKSFQGANPSNKEKNTVRTIKRLRIKKAGDFVYIDIEANGFLYKMVRNIVGTLLEAGQNRLPKGSIKKRAIGGQKYYYHQFRKGEKVVHKYLGKKNPSPLIKQIDQRKLLHNELKKVKAALKLIKMSKGRKRDSSR